MASSSVIEKESADKLAIVYSPRKFPVAISEEAKSFHRLQTEAQNEGGFRIERLIAEQNGIAELERLSMEEKVEKEALEKFKEIQEQAYQAAYQLGLDEGREKAFQDHHALFEKKLGDLETIMTSLSTLKQDLISFNETHLLKLIFYLAGRLAMDEIQTRPEIILTVIKKAIESAQSEEKVVVKISAEDNRFIQGVLEKLPKEMEVLKKVRIEESDNIKSGGCIVETNYGVVDATVQQRVDKLWESLSHKLPKIKDQIGEG